MSNKEIHLKYEPRPQQSQILEFFKKSVEQDKKFMMIDAPTGSGKSYLPALIGDWYIKNVDSNANIDVITCTKMLQDQYTTDFPFIANVKGKSNYHCERHDTNCEEASQINKASGQKCLDCPYKKDFNGYLTSRVSLTNFHMYNSLRIFVAMMLDNNRDSNILFVDETHLYEENFCDFISNTISPRALSLLGIDDKKLINKISRIDNIEDAELYITRDLMPVLEQMENDYMERASRAQVRKERLRLMKKHKKIESFRSRFDRFLKDESKDNWVMETERADDGSKIIEIQPVWAKDYLQEYVWDKYDYVVMMSGTILEPSTFAEMMGVDKKRTSYFRLEHRFPASRRPVIFVNSGNLSRKYFDQSIRKTLKHVRNILKMHKDKKGIIHTGNYEIAETIEREIGDSRLLFPKPDDRELVLEHHMTTDDPTVLVSPSMYTGLDLKDDLSRFQVIVKMPYPYLGSAVVKKRKEHIARWYNWKTFNDLLQSYGRSIRNRGDWAYTYILDSSFRGFARRNANLMPEYFAEALQEGRKFVDKLKAKRAG